ncbi:MAG TPA: condensation domain-containing protein, partial [Candidatus Binatia bacterium]|nr:condensation domain-containing protein [Candidatus Binatia bacterium]
MTISEFLSHLRSKEIKLWIEDDNLCYRAPVGALTSAVAAELAKRKTEILEVLRAPSVVTLPISRTSRDQKLPLSFAQQRLWFLDQFEPGPFYNIAKAMRLNGPLNMEALQKSLDAILSRHEILRTNIAVMDGNPTQVITESRSIKLSVIDLSQWSNRDHQAEMHRLVNAEARRPFNLSSDLMLRVTLLHLGENDHVLLLVMHHIASDAWSMGILYRELSALYQAFSTGKPCRLAELPIQYADFAIWQRQWLQGEVFEKQFSYWKRQLSGIPVLELPTDRPRPAVQTFPGGRQSLVLSKNLSNALKALSRKEGVTFFMTLLAAFQTLLHRYTGQEDIAVGSPIANRTRSEIEGLIGFFVNTLVLRTDLSGNPNFRELLARVRKVALGAYEHQDLPFEKIVEELKPERDLSHNPLFQIMFSLQNVPRQSVELPDLTLRAVDVTFGTAKFDLTLFMIEEAGSLTASLAYNTDLFNDATISRMLGHFQVLLQGIVANPDRRLSDLPILSQAEKQRLLVEWNNTKRDYPQD